MKKTIVGMAIIFVLIITAFIGYRTFFYYQTSNLKELTRVSINGEYFNTYTTPQDILIYNNRYKDETQLFNEVQTKREIKDKLSAIKKAQKVTQFFYDGCANEQPFLVKHNSELRTWIVHGNYLKMVQNGILGGDVCVVISEETGDVLFFDHT